MGQEYLNLTVKSANQSRPKGPMNQIDFGREGPLELTFQLSISIYRYSCNSGDVAIILCEALCNCTHTVFLMRHVHQGSQAGRYKEMSSFLADE